MDHLEELDSRIGAVAVMSLNGRGLIPQPGRGVGVDVEGAELADRVAGALVGSACGSALGLPYEWKSNPGAVADPRAGARFAADVQLLVRSLELQFEHDIEAPVALAEWLAEEPRLRNPGNAIPAVIDRLQVGVPWYEAGVGSFGAGAIVRGVAAGIVFRHRPEWRPIVAGLDAVVTHATPAAVTAAVTVAESIAVLLSQPMGAADATAVLDAIEARATSPEAAAVLALVRTRLERGKRLRNRPEALPAVAAALYHALRNLSDPEVAIRTAVSAGGDTDTVGALVGAFVGAANGLNALPARWRTAVRDLDSVVALATRIAGAEPRPAPMPVVESREGVHISFLLDRSGSMERLTGDVIGGYNTFIASQQGETGECSLTTVQFDSSDPFEVLLDDVALERVTPLGPDDYQPRGMTPLYDAIASLLDHAEHREHQRSVRGESARDQVVVVFTDGLENASQRATHEQVFTRVDALKQLGWTFVFLGANQDSYATGGRLGLAAGSVSDFDASSDGVRAAFLSLDRASHSFRGKTHLARRAQRDDYFEGRKEAEIIRRKRPEQ